MIFPYVAPYPKEPFSRAHLDNWIALHLPTTIEMTDRQYMHLADLMGFNLREYRGIPIVFIDAPKS